MATYIQNPCHTLRTCQKPGTEGAFKRLWVFFMNNEKGSPCPDKKKSKWTFRHCQDPCLTVLAFFYQSYFQDEHKMLLLMANYDAKMTYSFNSNYFFFRFCLRRPFWNQNRIKMAWISILSVKTFKLSNQVQFFSFIGSRPDYCLASSCHPLTYSQSMCPLSNCQTKPCNSL